MAPRSTRRVSFAEPADSGVAAESPHPVADTHAYDPCPQPAVRGHSAITAPEMPAAADEPEPGSVEEGGDKRTELSGHTRQVRDNPFEGASAPSSACCATSLACQSLTCVHAPQHQISLRPFQLPTGVQDVLLERAIAQCRVPTAVLGHAEPASREFEPRRGVEEAAGLA